MTAYRDVCVAQKGGRGGWPEDTARHVFSAVLVAGPVQVKAFDPDEFERASRGQLVVPLLTVGFADRPGLGKIAARTAMLSRSFPEIGLIRPAALVAYGEDRSNTAPAYFERGIELVVVPEGRLSES